MRVNHLAARLPPHLLGLLGLLSLLSTACCRTDQTNCATTTPITQAGSSDGSGNNARFNQPGAIAVDAGGNLFVTDTANNTLRKITAAGVVSTLAGSAGDTGNADGSGAQARFSHPGGVAIDVAGNLYLADTLNHTIRKVSAAGLVSTLAGSAGLAGQSDGTAGNARFNQPWGIARDAAGNLYVTDTGNHTVRKITSAGVVTTLAGAAANPGDTDGNGIHAQFNFPRGIAIDSTANLYIADSNNNTIRKLSASGDVITLAGTAGAAGSNDGSGQRARFNQPTGIVIDSAGNIRVSDASNQLIRGLSQTSVVSTLAGAAGIAGNTDSGGNHARFDQPMGIASDTANNIFVADSGNNLIRKVTPAGEVSTLLRSGDSSSCLCLFKF